MDIANEKVVGLEHVSILDALNAPCLSFKLYHHDVPEIEDTKLMIKVGKNESDPDLKQVVFELSRPLLFFNGVSDEFVIESRIKQNRVTMTAKIIRKVAETKDGLLEESVIEEIPYQAITLLEGENYITTNLDHMNLEILYPKDTEFNRNYLNVALYHEQPEKNQLEDLYFTDAFTKTTDGINIDANNLNINCLTSNHNHFHLDSEGNLTVKSLTVEESIGGDIDYNEILNLVYPIGSIYMSVNMVDPGTIFGGTWESFAKGKTLVGVDTEQTEFNTVEKMGGEKTHKLLKAELPNYKMNLLSGAGANYSVKSYAPEQSPVSGNDRYYIKYNGVTKTNSGYDITVSSGGSNTPHNNLQPYITCYMWKRVA